jgi:hypothetical protein
MKARRNNAMSCAEEGAPELSLLGWVNDQYGPGSSAGELDRLRVLRHA